MKTANWINISELPEYWGAGVSDEEARRFAKAFAVQVCVAIPGVDVYVVCGLPRVEGPAAPEIRDWIERHWREAIY